jgi:hypothetical protein
MIGLPAGLPLCIVLNIGTFGPLTLGREITIKGNESKMWTFLTVETEGT